jgi:hypothetical protein
MRSLAAQSEPGNQLSRVGASNRAACRPVPIADPPVEFG